MEIELMPLLNFALLNISVVLLGYILIKKQQIALSWLLLLLCVGDIYVAFPSAQPIMQMLTIIATTFTCMKVISVACEYNGKQLTLTFKQWLAFAIGWAGMRAKPFEALGNKAVPQALSLIGFGISRVAVGALLVWLAHQAVKWPLNADAIYIVISAILLVGLSLILHFGLLGISAGAWRLLGVHTYVLFKQPVKAMSLTEFWSKRWNLAFSEMTSITIYRPLKSRVGNAAALMLAFLFSGLLHELALSVPVHSGYGLPLLYFFIQGLVVLIERALVGHKAAFLQHAVWARVWVLCWLVLPMPLLFHEQFMKQIVWPLAGFGN
jgi:hypothetical protein